MTLILFQRFTAHISEKDLPIFYVLEKKSLQIKIDTDPMPFNGLDLGSCA